MLRLQYLDTLQLQTRDVAFVMSSCAALLRHMAVFPSDESHRVDSSTVPQRFLLDALARGSSAARSHTVCTDFMSVTSSGVAARELISLPTTTATHMTRDTLT